MLTQDKSSCFQKISLNFKEEKAECEKKIFFPVVKAFNDLNDSNICFTNDTGKDHFNGTDDIKYKNMNDCQITQQEEITNITHMSCKWPRKLNDDQMLLSVLLNCNRSLEKERFCLVMIKSKNSLEDVSAPVMHTCLPSKLNKLIENVTVQTTSRIKRSPTESPSFVDFIKTNMTPILASVAGILFVIIIVLLNHIRKQYRKNGGSERSEFDPEESNEDELYHEPNHLHTSTDIENNITDNGNYEYAYGHVGPVNPSINIETSAHAEPENNHNYMNITALPVSRHLQGEKDYINITKEDIEYIEMKNSYQALDRSSMVNDKEMYQGLIEHKKQTRPQVAPKPKFLRRQEEPEISYVKVF